MALKTAWFKADSAPTSSALQRVRVSISWSDWIREIGLYVLATVLTVGVVGYLVISRESARPGQEIVRQAEQSLLAVQAELADLEMRPRLRPLPETWTQAHYLAAACGVSWNAVQADAGPSPGDYAGPAAHWEATLSGTPPTVVMCAHMLVENFPIWLGQIQINGPTQTGEAILRISVLGALAPA